MKKCKITVMRMVCHKDLMEKYENPIVMLQANCENVAYKLRKLKV